jgi:hypothetical protein
MTNYPHLASNAAVGLAAGAAADVRALAGGRHANAPPVVLPALAALGAVYAPAVTIDNQLGA